MTDDMTEQPDPQLDDQDPDDEESGGHQPTALGPPLSGLLVIDKPLRMTSTQVCRIIKRRLVNGGATRKVKVGHGGTLDPLATGVVVVLIGKATKLCEKVMAGEKRYTAVIDLAHTSPTDDGEGTITEVAVETPPAAEDVARACAAFVGKISQHPPIYSALKVGGRAAYDFARRGQEVKLQPRMVEIYALEVLDYQWPLLRIDVRCGRGVYIRSLARDIGTALGVGGMLRDLRRTQVGQFMIEQASEPDNLPQNLTQVDLRPVEQA